MKKKVVIVVIALLVISNLYTLLMWQNAKYDDIYDQAVPAVELIAAMGFYGQDVRYGKVVRSNNPADIAFGSITGFVVFPDTTDQPRELRQYYRIEALKAYDENDKQLFLLEEILKLNSIPPRELDPVLLSVTSNTEQTLTLENDDGSQTFAINKANEKVSVIDSDGTVTTLITNQDDYRDFILELLR